LLAGEGRVVDTLGVFAIELELSSDDSTDLDQRVTDAVSTTITDFSAADISIIAVFARILSGIDAFRVEIATSSFTEMIRFSVVIINREPASTFEETKSEFRDSSSDNTSGGHEIPLEESSGNMGTSIVFHDETGDSTAAIVRSESLSQRRKIKDSSGVTIDSSGLDVASENAAVGINKVVVKRTVHTEGVDEFVGKDVDIEIVSQGIGVNGSKLNIRNIDTDVDDNGSSDIRGNGTEGSGGDPASSRGDLSIEEDEDITFKTTVGKGAGSSETTESLGSRGNGTAQGIFGLQSSLKVVNDSRDNFALIVASPFVGSVNEKLEISGDSVLRVSGEGSSFLRKDSVKVSDFGDE